MFRTNVLDNIQDFSLFFNLNAFDSFVVKANKNIDIDASIIESVKVIGDVSSRRSAHRLIYYPRKRFICDAFTYRPTCDGLVKYMAHVINCRDIDLNVILFYIHVLRKSLKKCC